jgi:hypothetical protein
MAHHLATNAQVQAVLVKTVSNLKPAEVAALVDLLARTVYTKAPDEGSAASGFPGSTEATLGTIFPSGALTW